MRCQRPGPGPRPAVGGDVLILAALPDSTGVDRRVGRSSTRTRPAQAPQTRPAIDRLRSARLAVVGLDTTTGQSPVIVAAVVHRLTGGVITAGPFSYWAAPDARLAEVPARCWPTLRLAPPWAELGRLTPRVTD